MNHRVVVTPTARAEAMDAYRWYAKRSPAAARKWRAGPALVIQGLSDDPERQPVSDEDSEVLGCQTRLLFHGRRRGVFRILFTIKEGDVWILRVRHGAQGPIEP